MARSSRLKVFRTPIGFHDAYVAAPSQKAALEAWGSESNLFAQGAAEAVTDPALMAEPLAKPGVVIKRLRGTAAEQIAALGPDPIKQKRAKDDEEPAAAKAPAKSPPKAAKPKPQPKPKPRPDRAALDQAEAALADLNERYQAQQKEIRDQEAALARARRDLEKTHKDEVEGLEQQLADAEASYDKLMREWRKSR